MRPIQIFSILVFSLLTIYIIFYFSYGTGFKEGEKEGYESGREEGYEAGREEGYNKGYELGNKTGYQTGFKTGNSSGFSSGFVLGNATGFNLGNITGYAGGYKSGRGEGYEEGKKEGYDDGFKSGYEKGVNESATHKYTLRDPTYWEVVNFLDSDPTNENEYIAENFAYVCTDFASDVCRNAQKLNLDCHLVELIFENATGSHIIISFDTIDRGIVFFEPQDDREVEAKIGTKYYRANRYQFLPDVVDDTIIKIKILP